MESGENPDLMRIGDLQDTQMVLDLQRWGLEGVDQTVYSGLEEQTPFRAFLETDPTRIVIDFETS